ncbi:hypothetical protein C8039_01300 [Halogeometricum sp. wsp3]|nr:hypothetical protein C8039_01300 [Halogeometricum sp. wsp3]
MRHGVAVLACLVIVGSLPLSVAGASVNASISLPLTCRRHRRVGRNRTLDTTVQSLELRLARWIS